MRGLVPAVFRPLFVTGVREIIGGALVHSTSRVCVVVPRMLLLSNLKCSPVTWKRFKVRGDDAYVFEGPDLDYEELRATNLREKDFFLCDGTSFRHKRHSNGNSKADPDDFRVLFWGAPSPRLLVGPTVWMHVPILHRLIYVMAGMYLVREHVIECCSLK